MSEKEWIASIQNSISGIKINDIENVLFRFAKCCNPVPGDSILGFITRGRGISIHKINCKEGEFLKAIKEKSDRIIPITWDFSSKNIANHKTAEIKINSIKINNFFLEIFKILSKLKIEVLDSKLKNLDYHSEGVIRIMLKAGDEKKIMKRLRSLKGVTSVVIRILDDLK